MTPPLPDLVSPTDPRLAALKADRKRLKAEKFDLLNQMKQLYQTLEDKERELREFIRNYELVRSESRQMREGRGIHMITKHSLLRNLDDMFVL